MIRRRIYLSHPYGKDPLNIVRANSWLQRLGELFPNDVIVASWIIWASIELYTDEEEAITACVSDLLSCDCIALAGVTGIDELSPGMSKEYRVACFLHLPVIKCWEHMQNVDKEHVIDDKSNNST
jgi:hypothetical protein